MGSSKTFSRECLIETAGKRYNNKAEHGWNECNREQSGFNLKATETRMGKICSTGGISARKLIAKDIFKEGHVLKLGTKTSSLFKTWGCDMRTYMQVILY